MLRGYTSFPLEQIALWGFGLNVAWEFGQCTLLYDMWDWGFWRATAWMWGAIFGDVVIVLGVVLGATLIVGSTRLRPPKAVGSAALFGVGFLAAVGLEWAAQALHLWGYSNLMPMLTVFGHNVGLSPVVQVTVLPAMSCWCGSRSVL